MARLGLDGQTVFSGTLKGEERLAALAAADVVIYPGKDEIFGLVALEALLVATPPVVAADCGCGEVVARTGGGLVVPEGDVEAFASALRQVLENPRGWRARAQEGGEKVRLWIGEEVVAKQLEELYVDVLRSKVSRRPA